MVDRGWTRSESPFHAGELAIQARLGIQERIDKQGRRFIREYLTKQHQQFFAQLSYLIVGTVDSLGNPWASILVGQPGFVNSPSDRLMQIEATPLYGDPLTHILEVGIDIGLLGIKLHTRRRNRVNGIVRAIDEAGFLLTVEQSFGNCPQYIQARMYEWSEFDPTSPKTVQEIDVFSKLSRTIVNSADTFFITTAYQDSLAGAAKGVDVSHRGGKPGFVRIDNERTLTIPDFSGNCYFNTFGNLEINPKAGLLFTDFKEGNLLYLTGIAEVIWSGTEISQYAGAERLLRFHLDKGFVVKNSLPWRWSDPEFSPRLKNTGSW